MAKQKKGAAVAPKVLEAQHRNEIIRRFSAFITSQLGAELAMTIPRRDYEIMYMCKTGGIRILPAQGNKFPKDELKVLKDTYVAYTRKERINFLPGKPMEALYDAITLGIPLIAYLTEAWDKPTAIAPLIREAIGTKEILEEIFNTIAMEINNATYVVGIFNSSYEQGFCYTYNDVGLGTLASLTVSITRHLPEKRTFRIDGYGREAYRVAWYHMLEPITKLRYTSLRLADLNIAHPSADIPLPVYIQEHAIQRLSERIDSISETVLLLSIFASVNEPLAIEVRPGKLLLEMKLNKIKLGYFVATVEGDALLIRTFLFITSNGTPEGQRLKELTGLQMLDKKYLAIDRLSSFVAAEVAENAQIRAIFSHVGCDNLFSKELQNVSSSIFINKHTPAVKLPDYIASICPKEKWLEMAACEQTTEQITP